MAAIVRCPSPAHAKSSVAELASANASARARAFTPFEPRAITNWRAAGRAAPAGNLGAAMYPTGHQ
jgi:hypothetical protein